MLASLSVRDIVLIERAELQFVSGLNVLTGETGAGKSILLDALGLAAGERGQGRAAIRAGASQAAATAIFEPETNHPLRGLLADNGLAPGAGDEIILRRTVSADGRTRAFVNDQPVGARLARDIGSALLEVHGLADDRGLFDTANHRTLLDSFGGHQGQAEDVVQRFASLAASQARLTELQQAEASAKAELEYLTHAADEIRQLGPREGEEPELAATRALLMNSEKLAQDISAASEFVAGDGGAEVALAGALRRLSRLPAEAKTAAQAAETALESALALAQEARTELQSLLARLEVEPGKLEHLEDRLFALRDAARKYNVVPDALAGLLAGFMEKHALLDGGVASMKAVESEVARARDAYGEAAAALSQARSSAAKRLEAAVAKELQPLKLGGARFKVSLSKAEAGPNGLERAQFEIATVEGAAFGVLAKIASGGELARFSLALKVALAEASPPAVLVFDEVDRGVGGAVAAAVGERLQKLAETAQVLLVTHSPQVAARAARHFRITREGDATRIEELPPDKRVEEIARMLAGAAVSEEARAAARRLLQEAQSPFSRKKRVRA